MEMRRKDLEVTGPEKIDAIIGRCDFMSLALADGTHPYVIPLSFGFVHEGGVRRIYFHSASQGRKVDLCRKLGYAGFSFVTDTKVNPNEKACDFSMRYQSVVGEGTVAELTGIPEKTAALQTLMAHYSGRSDWSMPEAVVQRTCVFCLTVTEISGREHG